MIFKTICPYCGGRCEAIGGEDGNPFGRKREGKMICTVCGRTVSGYEPIRISDEELLELMTDADVISFDGIETKAPDTSLSVLKILATAEGGGVKREARAEVAFTDGFHSLGNDYPFGRRDVDAKPAFSLCEISVNGNEISIAGETFSAECLPKTITKRLTAYGYGYVPWEETITVTVSIL